MKLIAAGRASEILDLGDGRVLRRFKAGGDSEREALVMRHALAAGYPAPRVLEVLPDGLVLERIEGPTMLDVFLRKPWAFRRLASVLAGLHSQLHEIAAPPRLPSVGSDDRLLHLDLHPENVILSPGGPVVIDWANARRGEPALDLALVWVIGATSAAGLQMRLFLRHFLSHFDRAEIVPALPAAAEYRMADVNVTDAERAAVQRFVDQIAVGWRGS